MVRKINPGEPGGSGPRQPGSFGGAEESTRGSASNYDEVDHVQVQPESGGVHGRTRENVSLLGASVSRERSLYDGRQTSSQSLSGQVQADSGYLSHVDPISTRGDYYQSYHVDYKSDEHTKCEGSPFVQSLSDSGASWPSIEPKEVDLAEKRNTLHQSSQPLPTTQEAPRTSMSLLEAKMMRIELLIVSQDHEGDNELMMAAIKKVEPYVLILIQCLIKRKATKYLNMSNDLHQTILYLAVYNNLQKVLSLLASIDEVEKDCRDLKGNTPLHLACQKGFIELVVILTADSANKKTRGRRQIGYTRTRPPESEESEDSIKSKLTGLQLAELRNYNNLNCLHVAVSHKQLPVVEHLVGKLKMDPNAQGGSRGMTPLHIAVENNDAPMIVYLIVTAKVDINLQTYDKWSPMQFAMCRKQDEIVKLLMQHKAHTGDYWDCHALLQPSATNYNDDDDDDDDS